MSIMVGKSIIFQDVNFMFLQLSLGANLFKKKKKKIQTHFACCKLSELSVLAGLWHFTVVEGLFRKLIYSDTIWRVQILHIVMESRIYYFSFPLWYNFAFSRSTYNKSVRVY